MHLTPSFINLTLRTASVEPRAITTLPRSRLSVSKQTAGRVDREVQSGSGPLPVPPAPLAPRSAAVAPLAASPKFAKWLRSAPLLVLRHAGPFDALLRLGGAKEVPGRSPLGLALRLLNLFYIY